MVSTPDRPPYSLYPVLYALLCGPSCDHAYQPPLTPAYRATSRTHQVFLPIFDDLAESLTGQQAGGTAATHTFVQDADEAAVCHNGHGASDSSPGVIEPRSAEIGEMALEQRPGSGAPADFTRRRLSMASGMTMEAHEA